MASTARTDEPEPLDGQRSQITRWRPERAFDGIEDHLGRLVGAAGQLDPYFVGQEGDAAELRGGHSLLETRAADRAEDGGEWRIGAAVRFAAGAYRDVATIGRELDGLQVARTGILLGQDVADFLQERCHVHAASR